MAANFGDVLALEIRNLEEQQFKLWEQHQHLEDRIEGLKQALELWKKNTGTAAIPKPAIQASRRRRVRGSKFDAVLGFIREQGEKGATIEEMFRFATNQGLRLKRPSIRSHIFNRKGQLVKMGEGRYRVATPADLQARENAEGPTGGNPVEPSLKLVGAA